MTQKQQINQIVEQLKLDPTTLEHLDLNIEWGLEVIDVVLNEGLDPAQFERVFALVENCILAKTKYFRATEVC